MTATSQHEFTEARLGRRAAKSLIEGMLAPVLDVELRMFDAFIAVDLAHVTMLAERGVLPTAQATPLLKCLLRLRESGSGDLLPDPRYGNLLLQVERYIEGQAGAEVAGMLQLARSRIDQGSAVFRLWGRDGVLEILEAVTRLLETLRVRAEEWADVIMPGYTHLQHAQPWTLGHYALAEHALFARDADRLYACYERLNLSALGGVALAGTGWPIDRKRTAELLGHTGVVRNSNDAGFFQNESFAELSADLSILMSGLGRLAGDLYVWSTWEFNMVELDEALCGTSSIMAQKKNPYALERTRALAGEAVGWLPSQLGLLKLATSSDLDLYASSVLVGDYFLVTGGALALMEDVVRTLRVNRKVMRERAGVNWSTASSLADEIVRQTGLDFRRSHQIVATLVRQALEKGLTPTQIGADQVNIAARQVMGRDAGLADEQVRQALDPVRFVATRRSEGSVSPREVASLLADAADETVRQTRRLTVERERLAQARTELDTAISRFL